MPDHNAEHAHFICDNCRTVFCTQDERFAAMATGDGCPECHVATVRVLPDIAEDGPEGVLQGMMEGMHYFGAQQSHTTRIAKLLEVSARLYPHIAVQFPTPEEAGAMKVGADLTEIDVARGLRAVALAFGMETAILARIKQEREQEHGA